MQWWFAHQPSPPVYIFNNVLLVGDSRDKVLEGRHYICQHLGDPIFVDAASLGSIPTGLGGFGPTLHRYPL